MQMIHALPGIPARVRHDPITVGIESLLARELGGKRQQSTQQSFTLSTLKIPNRGDMSDGDDQQVHRSLGVDVPEGQRFLRPLHDFGRNLAGHNPAE